MKPTFTCIAILLAALFLGSGCATTTTGGGQEKAKPAPQEIYTPPVAAPQ
jgi:predicted small secreted protein